MGFSSGVCVSSVSSLKILKLSRGEEGAPKKLVIYIYFYIRITQNEGEIALLNLSSKK
jgi:hypothetical protein